MRLLYFLADVFINTFGTTQPTERARKQAALFILGLMIVVVVAAISAFFLIHSVL